jgi:hypothetical protein
VEQARGIEFLKFQYQLLVKIKHTIKETWDVHTDMINQQVLYSFSVCSNLQDTALSVFY